jgi:hypothetical protein
MRRLIALLTAISFFSAGAQAQCGKKLVITASKTEFLGADSTVQRADDEQSSVEFDSSNITITHGAQQEKMVGTVSKYACNWKVPFKEGKTVMKAVFPNDNGEMKNVSITITGKNDKIIFFVEIDDQPDRKIRLTADKFEERK